MKIQIKHRFNSSILFEHECENNTIKETLIQGLKANADLSGSDLSGSDLSGSNLSYCNLPIFAKWSFSIKNNQIIKIGCKEKTVDDWDLFFASKEEFDTKRGTPEFKQIEAMYLAHKAYLTHLNS